MQEEAGRGVSTSRAGAAPPAAADAPRPDRGYKPKAKDLAQDADVSPNTFCVYLTCKYMFRRTPRSAAGVYDGDERGTALESTKSTADEIRRLVSCRSTKIWRPSGARG